MCRRCKGYLAASIISAYPCKVWHQGRSVGKIKFTRNIKMAGGWEPPPPPSAVKVGTAEKMLKSRTHTFWRYLKRCFGIWNFGETFENKDANWWFLAVFETIFLKLELLRTFWKRCRLMVHSTAIWNDLKIYQFNIIECSGRFVCVVYYILYFEIGIP